MTARPCVDCGRLITRVPGAATAPGTGGGQAGSKRPSDAGRSRTLGPACVICGSTIDVQVHRLDPIGEGGDKRAQACRSVVDATDLPTASGSGDTARAMSQENIDTVRRACQAWNKGDISIYRAMYAPDAIAHAGPLAPEFPGGEITGPDQIIAALESLMATFEQSELIPTDFIEDDDGLVVPVVMRAVARESPATIEWHLAIAYRFRDGLIIHQAWYPTLEEALASLSEQDAHADS